MNIVLAIPPKLEFLVKNKYDMRVWDLHIVGYGKFQVKKPVVKLNKCPLFRVSMHTVAGFQYLFPVVAVVEFQSTASWRNLELEDFISGRPLSYSVPG